LLHEPAEHEDSATDRREEEGIAKIDPVGHIACDGDRQKDQGDQLEQSSKLVDQDRHSKKAVLGGEDRSRSSTMLLDNIAGQAALEMVAFSLRQPPQNADPIRPAK
jgi:hypothetical protein